MSESTELTTEQAGRQATLSDLRGLIDWLEARPECPLPYIGGFYYHCYSDKEKFLAVARAMGAFEKTIDKYNVDTLQIEKGFGAVSLVAKVDRSAVCRKVLVVKEVEEWQCDPILEPGEQAAIDLGVAPEAESVVS